MITIQWHNFTRILNLTLVATILITVLLLFVRPSMDLTGIGRIHHLKTKGDSLVAYQEYKKINI